MNEDRTVLEGAMWARTRPMLPGKATDPGVTAAVGRMFLEAVLWRIRTGSPWRDLPEHFGKEAHLQALPQMGPFGCLRTGIQRVVRRVRPRIHLRGRHHRAGTPEGCRCKRGTSGQGIGRSRGGLTGRIVAVVDALGCLVRFVILPGQAHDLAGVPELLADLRYGALIGDKAFDAGWLLEEIEDSGAMAVIPARRNRTVPRDHDREMYKWRHQIGNFFARIREFRAIATRYDKPGESFAAAIHLVSGVVAAT